MEEGRLKTIRRQRNIPRPPPPDTEDEIVVQNVNVQVDREQVSLCLVGRLCSLCLESEKSSSNHCLAPEKSNSNP